LVKNEADAVAGNSTTEAKVPEVTEAVTLTTTLASSSKTEANLIDKEDADALEEEEEQLAEESDRQQQKRNIPLPVKQQKYNNWFGRNDWSQRLQKVQGRIRFKNQGY
jgi:hypothetical protein